MRTFSESNSAVTQWPSFMPFFVNRFTISNCEVRMAAALIPCMNGDVERPPAASAHEGSASWRHTGCPLAALGAAWAFPASPGVAAMRL